MTNGHMEDGSYKVEIMETRYTIRPQMVKSLMAYVTEHIPVGDFLQAVISNDMYRAMSRADRDNFNNLPAFVYFLAWEVPSDCWGSREAYKDWIAKRTENNNEGELGEG